MERAGFRINLLLAVLIVALAILSLMVGPAGLSPPAAIRPGPTRRGRAGLGPALSPKQLRRLGRRDHA